MYARILTSACLLSLCALAATTPTHAQTISAKATLPDAPSPQVANLDVQRSYLPAPNYFRKTFALKLENDDSPLARKHTRGFLKFFEENKTRRAMGAAAVIEGVRYTYKGFLKLRPRGY